MVYNTCLGQKNFTIGLPAECDFDNGAISKFDDVLLEHRGLPHVLPLAVHLKFVERTILRCSYLLSFVVGPLLHA